MLTLIVLSVSLAVDAAAVSASLGAARVPWARLWLAALLFGGFQAAMAAAGAVGGLGLAQLGGPWPTVVGGLLLIWIGGRMATAARESERPPEVTIGALLGLAVATSIDALAAGVTLPTLAPPVGVAIAAIGGASLGLSLAAAAAGRWLGTQVGPVAERFAGLVLIGLGLRLLARALGV